MQIRSGELESFNRRLGTESDFATFVKMQLNSNLTCSRVQRLAAKVGGGGGGGGGYPRTLFSSALIWDAEQLPVTISVTSYQLNQHQFAWQALIKLKRRRLSAAPSHHTTMPHATVPPCSMPRCRDSIWYAKHFWNNSAVNSFSSSFSRRWLHVPAKLNSELLSSLAKLIEKVTRIASSSYPPRLHVPCSSSWAARQRSRRHFSWPKDSHLISRPVGIAIAIYA